jgi:transposase-like protein
MSKPMTVQQFFALFPSDEVCLDHLFRTRFGEHVQCPKCNRISKFYRLASEQAYSCQWCGHHVHPMVDTPFEKSHTSLQRWYYAMYLFTTTRHGVSAKELQRQFGCSYKTAWRMGHEIRKYMAALDMNGPLDGVVEVDETHIGGKKKGLKGRASSLAKTSVIAMYDRESGEVISQVVPNIRGYTLRQVVRRHVRKGSTLHTDESPAYDRLQEQGYGRKAVTHGKKEYARGDVHVNSLEGYFSILKRSIRSTHVWVSEKHMPKYLAEFEYRMNLRKTPRLMFDLMLSFVRLVHKPPKAEPIPF